MHFSSTLFFVYAFFRRAVFRSISFSSHIVSSRYFFVQHFSDNYFFVHAVFRSYIFSPRCFFVSSSNTIFVHPFFRTRIFRSRCFSLNHSVRGSAWLETRKVMVNFGSALCSALGVRLGLWLKYRLDSAQLSPEYGSTSLGNRRSDRGTLPGAWLRARFGLARSSARLGARIWSSGRLASAFGLPRLGDQLGSEIGSREFRRICSKLGWAWLEHLLGTPQVPNRLSGLGSGLQGARDCWLFWPRIDISAQRCLGNGVSALDSGLAARLVSKLSSPLGSELSSGLGSDSNRARDTDRLY